MKHSKYCYVEFNIWFFTHSGEKSLHGWAVSTTTWITWCLQCGTSMSDSCFSHMQYYNLLFMGFMTDDDFLTIYSCLFCFFKKDLSAQISWCRWIKPCTGKHMHIFKKKHLLRIINNLNGHKFSLIFNLLFPLAAALSLSWFHQILHSSAARQTECGSRKSFFFLFPITESIWSENTLLIVCLV